MQKKSFRFIFVRLWILCLKSVKYYDRLKIEHNKPDRQNQLKHFSSESAGVKKLKRYIK